MPRRGWPDRDSTGSIWLHWESWLARFGCSGRSRALWLAQSDCNARPGRSATPGWLDLAANECPNECPIDTIGKKKSMCSRTSCLDAACFARSATFLSCLKSSKSIYVVFRIDFEFDISFCVAPQKPSKNMEKRDFRTILFSEHWHAICFFSGGRRADLFF